MLALFAATLLTVVPSGAPDVFALPETDFVVQARHDAVTLQRYVAGLSRIRGQLPALKRLLAQRKKTALSPDEKQLLLTTWAALFDYVVGTEGIRQRYWNYWKVPVTDRVRHGWGFLLTHASLTVELAHGLAFVDIAGGHPQAETLLDEPTPELGVRPGSFRWFKDKVVHVATTTQLLTGDAYALQAVPLWRLAKLFRTGEGAWLVATMKDHSRRAKLLLGTRGVTLFAKAGADVAADKTAHAIFPLQRGVAEWMGDTRVHRVEEPLIGRQLAESLLPRMQPGDVLVARQNWFLSNIGLPGFWPHAELYLSRPEELAEYFDADPEVVAFTRAQPERAATFSELLSRRFPAKWRAFGGSDANGDPVRVIESISEGVSFTGVRHAMMTDYLGVMRPRRSKVEKAKAIVRAFGYQGRPYDFNFDFFSDSTLVCTELVFKSYTPARNMLGLKLPLVKVAGRMTLPANELVRLFDAEYERPDRQLDFVGFLDGREKERTAVEGDVHAFRKSHQRLKWDIAQQ